MSSRTLVTKLASAICLVTLLFQLSVPVLALTEEDINAINLDSVWHKSYSASSACGPSAGGPLSSPFFPQVTDTALLVQRIQEYIANTRPDSPLIEFASDFVTLGQQYNVNPALVVAIAQQENSFGTVGNALPPQYNIFNVRNGPGGTFGSYASISASIESEYQLLSGSLYLGAPSNFTTIEEIINRYAPPSDNNNTTGYIEFVYDVMNKILTGLDSGSAASPTPPPAPTSIKTC